MFDLLFCEGQRANLRVLSTFFQFDLSNFFFKQVAGQDKVSDSLGVMGTALSISADSTTDRQVVLGFLSHSMTLGRTAWAAYGIDKGLASQDSKARQ